MEAPETIFVNYRGFGVFDEPVSIKMQASQIEYTRTDTFIEKVCKFLDDRIKHDSIDYPMATKHLIEDFKKYIKG